MENRMRDALESDRARVQVGRISRFGLLEMSRQRLRPSLGETSAIVCPRCSGQGSIRDVESLSLSILRILQEEANKQKCKEIRAAVPLVVSSYLLNEKRLAVAEIEQQSGTRVTIVSNPEMETPHYEITGVNRQSETYEVEATAQPEPAVNVKPVAEEASVQKPSVSNVSAQRTPPPKKGLFASLFAAIGSLFSSSEKQAPPSKQKRQQPSRKRQATRSQRGQQARGSAPRGEQRRGKREDSGKQSGQQRRKQAPAKGSDGAGKGKSADERKTARGGKSQDRSGRPQRGERSDRPERKERAPRSEKSGKGDKSERTDRSERTEKSDKAQRRPASKRPKNTRERKRGPRPERREEQATPGVAAKTEQAEESQQQPLAAIPDSARGVEDAVAQAPQAETAATPIVDTQASAVEVADKAADGTATTAGVSNSESQHAVASEAPEASSVETQTATEDPAPTTDTQVSESSPIEFNVSDSGPVETNVEPDQSATAEKEVTADLAFIPTPKADEPAEAAAQSEVQQPAAAKTTEPAEESSAETSTAEPVSSEPDSMASSTEPEPAAVSSGGRAANDPREVRKRQLEAQKESEDS
ncbi:MAG TPA: hypothetical protein DCM64_03385 [Gammaproteobacteria bacterium]|nr:hypothetical protein [Gammaproteobacteria bacterium]